MSRIIAILFTAFLVAALLDAFSNINNSEPSTRIPKYSFYIEGGDCMNYNYRDYQLVSEAGQSFYLKRSKNANEKLFRHDLPKGKYTLTMTDVFGNQFEMEFDIKREVYVPFDFLINELIPEGNFTFNHIKMENKPIYITRDLNTKGKCMFSYFKIYALDGKCITEQYIDGKVFYKNTLKKAFIDDLRDLEKELEAGYKIDAHPYPTEGSDELEFRYDGKRKFYRLIDKRFDFPKKLESLIQKHKLPLEK